MIPLVEPELKTHVERLLVCTASFIEDVVVVEKFGDLTAWSGKVSVFALEDHPSRSAGLHRTHPSPVKRLT